MYFFIPKTNFMGKWEKFFFSNEICEECATTCWAKSEIDFYKLPAWERKVNEQRQIQFWNVCPKCQIENTTEWFYTSEEWIFCVETLFLLTVEGNLSQPAVSESWRFYLQLASTWCSTNKVIVFKTYPTPRIDLSVRVWLFTTSTTASDVWTCALNVHPSNALARQMDLAWMGHTEGWGQEARLLLSQKQMLSIFLVWVRSVFVLERYKLHPFS